MQKKLIIFIFFMLSALIFTSSQSGVILCYENNQKCPIVLNVDYYLKFELLYRLNINTYQWCTISIYERLVAGFQTVYIDQINGKQDQQNTTVKGRIPTTLYNELHDKKVFNTSFQMCSVNIIEQNLTLVDNRNSQSNNSNTTGNQTTNNTTGNQTSNNTTGNQTSNNTSGNQTSNNTTGNQTSNNTTGNQTSNNTTGNQTNNTTINQTSNSTTENQANNNTTGNQTENNTIENQQCTSLTQTNCTLNQNSIINLINNNNGALLPIITGQNGQVILCPPACLICQSASVCKICLFGYALSQTSQCTPCKGCKKCQNSNNTYCLSCYLPQLLDTNTNLCDNPIGCTNPACQTCTTVTNCLSCFQGYSLYNNDCVACIKGCNQCTTSQTNCDSDGCALGYVYFANTVTNINQCAKCTAGCASCQSQNLNNCIGCVSGFYSSLNSTTNSNSCLKCMENCKNCTSLSICISCVQNYMLSSDSTSCNLKCSEICYTCALNQPKKCLSCLAGYTYDPLKQTCIVDISCNTTATCVACPLKNILKNGNCLPCNVPDSNCAKCSISDTTSCSECITGYYLDSTASCTACPQTCTICQTQFSCSACQTGFYLKTESGQSIGTCDPCNNPCATCYINPDICLTCVNGYTLNGSKCISNNNVGFNIVINIDSTQYVLISQDLTQYMLSLCNNTNSGVTQKDIIITSVVSGSSSVSGSVSASSHQVASGLNSAISSGLSSQPSIGGYPVLSSSTTVNSAQSSPTSLSSANLGLILGVSIPLFILLIIALTVVIIKLKNAKKSQDFKGVNGKDSVQQIQKDNFQNVLQMI